MVVISSTEGNNNNQKFTFIKEKKKVFMEKKKKKQAKPPAIHPTADEPIQEAREEVAMANWTAFKDETEPHGKYTVGSRWISDSCTCARVTAEWISAYASIQ